MYLCYGHDNENIKQSWVQQSKSSRNTPPSEQYCCQCRLCNIQCVLFTCCSSPSLCSLITSLVAVLWILCFNRVQNSWNRARCLSLGNELFCQRLCNYPNLLLVHPCYILNPFSIYLLSFNYLSPEKWIWKPCRLLRSGWWAYLCFSHYCCPPALLYRWELSLLFSSRVTILTSVFLKTLWGEEL